MSDSAELEACHEQVHELMEELLQVRDETKYFIEMHNASLLRIEELVSDYMRPIHQ